MMVRQGDLLIVEVKSIPEGAEEKESRVLAEGEATGHMHELSSGEVYEYEGILFFRVAENETSVLEHPEHKAVTFKTGEYKVVRQREYTPHKWREKIVRD
jgi:hypothetical protein